MGIMFCLLIVEQSANQPIETSVSPSGPVQETGFEGNFERVVDNSREHPVLAPDVLSPSAESNVTLIKQRLLPCGNQTSVPPNDQQRLQPPQEQNLSTPGCSSEHGAQSFQYGSAEQVETDVDKSTGYVYNEGSEILQLAEEDQLSSALGSIVYLRDDRSLVQEDLPIASSSDALKKPSLCSYQSAILCSSQPVLPVSKALRGYQLELAQPSLKGLNSIICAPTGSGKTLTAGFIFQEQWKLAKHERRQFCGLFIVCQRTLVLQQRRALEDFLQSGILVGSVDENQLLKDVLLLPYSLIVLTAQKLINALDGGSVKIEKFGMLIMDECHHTDLNHPYNKIMRFYHTLRQKNPDVQLPMIVGLTASLGVGSGKHETAAQLHYINICANLNAKCITHVRDKENERELLHFNPKPTEDQISSVDPRPKDCPFYVIMTQLMGKIESESELIFSKPHERGTQTYENWAVARRLEATQRENLPHIIIACEALEKLNTAWMLHDQLRIRDAKEFLDSYFTSDWLPLQPLPMQKFIFTSFIEASERLDCLVQQETIEQCPQLKRLCGLLTHIHGNHSDARGLHVSLLSLFLIHTYIHSYVSSMIRGHPFIMDGVRLRWMHVVGGGGRAYFKGFQVVGHIGGETNRGAVGVEGADSGEGKNLIFLHIVMCVGELQVLKARSCNCRRQEAPND